MVYEPPASRFAGTPFNSPSERGRDSGLLTQKGEGIPLAPLRFAKGGFLASLGMTDDTLDER